MTSENARNIIARHNALITEWTELTKAAEMIGRAMHVVIWENRRGGITFERMGTLGEEITVHFEGYSCGETDYYEYSFPIAWLDDADWKVKYLKRLEDAKIKNARIEKEKVQEKKRQLERAHAIVIKAGWEGAGKQGKVVGCAINSETTQEWTPVLWDGEEDPEFFKSAGLERLFPEDYELLKKGFIGGIY